MSINKKPFHIVDDSDEALQKYVNEFSAALKNLQLNADTTESCFGNEEEAIDDILKAFGLKKQSGQPPK